MPGLDQDVFALEGVQLEAPVVQASPQDFEEDLPDLVGTADGPVVKVESRHVHWAVDGFGLCSSF